MSAQKHPQEPWGFWGASGLTNSSRTRRKQKVVMSPVRPSKRQVVTVQVINVVKQMKIMGQ